MNIKIKLRILNADLELDIENYGNGIFEFLDELVEFLKVNKGLISSNTNFPTQNTQTIVSDDNKFQKINAIPEDLSETDFSKELITLAQELRIDPKLIQLIFDFGAETQLPPLLIDIEGESRAEKQRTAISIILFVSHVLLNKNKISSHSLTPILIKSNIDPSESSKAFKGEYSKYVKIEGKSYRITPQGLLKAKKLIEELTQRI